MRTLSPEADFRSPKPMMELKNQRRRRKEQPEEEGRSQRREEDL